MSDDEAPPSSSGLPMVRPVETGIERAADVDDALLDDIVDCFVKFSRLQTVGMAGVGAGTYALFTVLPAVALVAIPLLLVGNVFADRALQKSLVETGLTPALAKRLVRATYVTPSVYPLFTSFLAGDEGSRVKMRAALRQCLAKC